MEKEMYQILQSTGKYYYLDLIVGNGQSIRRYYGQNVLDCIKLVEPNVSLRILPDAIFDQYFIINKKEGLKLRSVEPIKRRRSGYSVIPISSKRRIVKCISSK